MMKHTIMVVDDESVNLSVLSKLLIQGNNVRAYKSGQAALKALNDDPRPDLILLEFKGEGHSSHLHHLVG